MALSGVEVTSEVWLTCLTHALSTETEEIMGLLLGDVLYEDDGRATAHVWAAAPQTRSDRRKDRVETNPEQLAAATAEAERLSAASGRTTRVIGWYHSHPHITVFPSHVDVRTQGMYQMLDQGFIGLIFSCFNDDATKKVGRVQATAFQSLAKAAQPQGFSSPSPRPLPSPPPGAGTADSTASSHGNSDDLIVLPGPPSSSSKGLVQTQLSWHQKGGVAADSKGAGATTTAGTGFLQGGSAASDAAAVEEAVLRSHLDRSGADYIHKEVPMRVVPGQGSTPPELLFAPLVALQRILFKEEQTAYLAALRASSEAGKVHPLAAIHHSATYQASLCKLMEYCLSPVLGALWDRKHQLQVQLARLKEEAEWLSQGGGGGRSPAAGPGPSRSPTFPSSSPRASQDPAAALLGLRPPPSTPSTPVVDRGLCPSVSLQGVSRSPTGTAPTASTAPVVLFSDLVDVTRAVPVSERRSPRLSSRGPPMFSQRLSSPKGGPS